MADFIWDSFTEDIGDGTIDMDGDTFKCALFTDATLPAAGDYSTYTALAAAKTEVSNGNGYTTGGVTMTTIVWTQTSGTCKFDADDPQWTSATFTARYAVVYSSTGDALIQLIDFGSDKSVSGGTFTIELHTNGIFTLAQA